MSDSRSANTHILSLPENIIQGATDRIIGDIHGNAELFERIMAMRKHPGDRLFVAGDLTDRGEGSVKIIEEIVKSNMSGDGKIYSVRGNHEEMCINTIEALSVLVGLNLSGNNREELMLAIYVLSEQAKNDKEMRKIFSDEKNQGFSGHANFVRQKCFQ